MFFTISTYKTDAKTIRDAFKHNTDLLRKGFD